MKPIRRLLILSSSVEIGIVADHAGRIGGSAMAVAALESAASKIESEHGSLDVAWGKVCHLLVDKADLPANGGPSELGIFRAAYFGRAHRGPLLIGGGDSYVAAIEFGNPIAAEALIGYGNSSQPGSPHRTDQLPLFARKELRTVWRTRREVEAHQEARKAFWQPTKT